MALQYSIIIPAYNEAQELPATLEAVKTAMAAQAAPGELVVVDNNSSEEVRLSRLLKKWGRKQGLGFEIIRSFPAQTSARKLNWYSGPQILGWVFLMMLFPVAVRWRRLCGFWYRRPELHS